MSTIQGSASVVIDAPADAIYAVLSDYRNGHPNILPKQYFTGLEVEAGGIGEGTVIHVDMAFMGQKFHYHMDVTEPEPGYKLVETDRLSGAVTEFLLEPLENGSRTRVTISTATTAASGFAGMMERMVTPLVMRMIYKKELHQLAEYVTDQH